LIRKANPRYFTENTGLIRMIRVATDKFQGTKEEAGENGPRQTCSRSKKTSKKQ